MGWGDRIRRIRERAGLAQEDFGALFGRSQQTAANWENEKVKQPNLEWYQELTKLIDGVDINWAMSGAGDEPVALNPADDPPVIDRDLVRQVIIAVERFWQRHGIINMTPTEKADEIMRLSHVAKRHGIEAVEAMLERMHGAGG